MMYRFALIVVLLTAVSAHAATPVGSEFRVNTYTYDNQSDPAAAVDAAGNFVIVWSSWGQDGDGYGVFGQRFSSSGSPSGTEFMANTSTDELQGGHPGGVAVATRSDGGFIVAWHQEDSTPKLGIFARRYDNAGAAIGDEFQVSSYTDEYARYPSIAVASDDAFVVSWSEDNVDPSYGAVAQRFDSSGTPTGGNIQLNEPDPEGQGYLGASLATVVGDGFFTVWSSDFQDGSGQGLFGRRFESTGAALGTEFQVNEYTPGSQSAPSVAADANGNSVVVWKSAQDGDSCSVEARRYDDTGAEVGQEFQVNSHTNGCQEPTGDAVFMDAGGGFTIVWSSNHQGGSARGIFGQQFDSSGARVGTELQVHDLTSDDREGAVIAGTSSGDFVVAWHADDGDSFEDIHARRFQAVPPPSGECPPIDGLCTTGFSKGSLLVKEDVAGKEKLVLKMLGGAALSQTSFGNPVDGATIYSLCIYDDGDNLAGGSVVVDRGGDTCDGAPCWKPVGGAAPDGKGYKYKDTALDADGVLKLLLKGGDAGKSKVILKAKGPNLTDGIAAALQTTGFATVQLRSSDGICLSFSVVDIQKQEAGFFKGKFALP